MDDFATVCSEGCSFTSLRAGDEFIRKSTGEYRPMMPYIFKAAAFGQNAPIWNSESVSRQIIDHCVFN